MQVIHDGCNVEMVEWIESVPPVVPQYRDECVIARSRIERNLWWLCKKCGAKIRQSEIADGIRFADGKPVVINGKTFMTGLHRIVWHGGQDTRRLDEFTRRAREVTTRDAPCRCGCGAGEGHCSRPDIMMMHPAQHAAFEELSKPFTVADLKQSIAKMNEITNARVDGCIARISDTLKGDCIMPGTVVEVADNRMFRVGDSVLLHNVNDGWRNSPDVINYIPYVYETWDDWKSLA